MNNYQKHAWNEFKAVNWLDDQGKFKDEMQEMICTHVLRLLAVFGDEGHSGTSAPYAIRMFEKLANFEPLAPITGADEEWEEVADNLYQNIRLSSVFKDGKEGRPYYINAIVFREESGSCWTGSCENVSSRQYIRFPFTPKTFYIDVNAWEVNKDDESIKEEGSGWWVSEIKSESQLEEVFQYYEEYKL